MKRITVFLASLLLCFSATANDYPVVNTGVTVVLSKAIICFESECYPALIGNKTKPGQYEMAQRILDKRTTGYGGDVIQFRQLENSIQAIHRPWLGKPSERRLQRLKSDNPEDRKGITNGCINVETEIYEKLVDCCSNHILTVTP